MTADAPQVHHDARSLGVGLIIAVASLLGIVSVLSIWRNTVVFNTTS